MRFWLLLLIINIQHNMFALAQAQEQNSGGDGILVGFILFFLGVCCCVAACAKSAG